ncbi:MAG TPA: response regulator [Terriglobales bacterium]|nr:response regulator [Terriglobales bacterium]
MLQPTVLCVDDRPFLLQLRQAMLEDHGFSVVTASDAPTALAQLQTLAIAAVLLEYKSAGMDAEAVAWLIKRKFPQQRVILLSAYSDVPERVLWLVDEYVMKSEPADGLLRVIERVTGPATAKSARAAA